MSNCIKTLLLSTIVFVMGNNNNYCYSMVVHHVDQYGINRISNGWAIPDLDEHGNIIENEHFLQDGDYLRYEFFNQLDNLNQNHIQQLQQFLDHIDSDFYSIYNTICDIFKDIERQAMIPGLAAQQFNRNTINNEMNEFIPQNILNQYDNITFGQLSNYLSNKIYFIMINNMRQIQNIINAWNDQNINEVRYKIKGKIANCHYEINNIINSFLDFCNNHLDQNSVTQIRNSIEHYMNLLKEFEQQNNLEAYVKFYDQVEKIQQDINNNDDLINFNSYEQRCLDIMLELHRNLENRQNPPHNVDLIYDFARIYISFSEVFDNALTTEMINDFPNENVTNDDLDEAITFVRQLPNSMHAHVISTLINIKDQMSNHNLNQQQLEELIKNSVSHCIKYIINYVKTTLSELAKNNNTLTKIWNNYYVEKTIKNIMERIDRLYQFKQKYHLQ